MDDWLDSWDGPDITDSDNKKVEFDEKSYNEAQEVTVCPRLWIGGLGAAQDRNWLLSHNITHVLVTGAMLTQYFPGDFEYKSIACLDTAQQDVLSYFPESIDFIHRGRQSGGVLVHCQFGVSRSAAFCMAYVMHEQKITFEKAFDYVHVARPFVDPNSGFITQLKLFEQMGRKVDPKDERYKKFRKKTLM